MLDSEIKEARVADEAKADYYLDITDEVCPFTFVKTKLLLERAEAGAEVRVRLRGAEPLANVPRSVEEMGHRVLDCAPEVPGDADGPHLLRIRKTA